MSTDDRLAGSERLARRRGGSALPDDPRARQRITERQWEGVVLDLAAVCGWRWYHTFDSRRSNAGWPDLALWHPRRQLFLLRELKTDKGRVSKEQERAIAELAQCGIDAAIWRPADWPEVVAILAPNATGATQ